VKATTKVVEEITMSQLPKVVSDQDRVSAKVSTDMFLQAQREKTPETETGVRVEIMSRASTKRRKTSMVTMTSFGRIDIMNPLDARREKESRDVTGTMTEQAITDAHEKVTIGTIELKGMEMTDAEKSGITRTRQGTMSLIETAVEAPGAILVETIGTVIRVR